MAVTVVLRWGVSWYRKGERQAIFSWLSVCSDFWFLERLLLPLDRMLVHHRVRTSILCRIRSDSLKLEPVWTKLMRGHVKDKNTSERKCWKALSAECVLLTRTFFFLCEFYSCEVQFDLYFLPTYNKAVRFRFVIQQFFGKIGQFLYLHCKITTCQRRDAPQPTVFNCHTHGEHCPKRKQVKITTGPFVVLPVGLRRSGESLQTTSKY